MVTQAFKLPKQSVDPPLLRIEPFQGMDLSVTPTQIDTHRSPDMLNMLLDEKGALNKRTGYERVFDSLGPGKINGVFDFRKADGTVLFLLAHNTNLYSLVDGVPTLLYSTLANDDIDFFSMADKCYIMDGTNFLVYDGTTVSDVVPYIPTVTIANGSVATGSILNEDFNLIGTGFKETRSGDGTTTAFPLSVGDLDTTEVTATVDGAIKVEDTDFTVDRTLGIVTFTIAPTIGTNNIEMVPHKTFAGLADKVKKCRVHTIFGGANDTRVFISGNKDFPHIVRASGLYDPTYWPENRFYPLGNDNEAVQGFSKQYDYLVIHKEHSYYNMQFTLDVNGLSSFPTKPINDQVGTFAPKSVQIIENNPVSLDRTGVYMLVASNVRDERNIQHISARIDDKLLREPNLDKAVSIDHDRKYWLAVNGNVYVYDYSIQEWYIFDNIHASCFLIKDGELYFGSSTDGTLYRFMKDTEPAPYSDDGIAINAYWKSKYLTFGADELRKLIEKVFFSLKPDTRTSVDLYYITNKKESNLVKTERMDLLDFNNIDFNNFSFITSVFPRESMAKIKAKKVTHFQLILKNDKLDESMGILSLGIKYKYQSTVK